MPRKSTDGTPLNANFSDLMDVAPRQLEAFAEAQTAFTQRIQEASADWLKRVQTESAIASELGSKLTTARTFPDMAMAWQDWFNRHVELANEDAKRAAANVQEFVQSGTRVLTGGWSGPRVETHSS
jgi:hypothetical protein